MGNNFFIMGEPNAGKSTFLAALWHSINQNEIETKLKLKKIIADTQYLCQLENKWEEAEPLGRTEIAHEQDNMRILLTDGADEMELEIPDLSGESFQHIYDNRELTIPMKEKIELADIVLYFINVADIRESSFISKVPKKLRSEDIPGKKRQPSSDDPTQVQCIDLLQMITKLKKGKLKLGILLAAWDMAGESEQTAPKEFLKKRMNMLWQYLEANRTRIDSKIWGVSAQGGSLDDAEELCSIEDPIRRIKVFDEGGECFCDLTRIIFEMSGDM